VGADHSLRGFVFIPGCQALPAECLILLVWKGIYC
jgi:hypothetical protein